MTKSLVPAVLLLLLVVVVSHSKTAQGATEMDELRIHYISLEKALWGYLEKKDNRTLQTKKVFDNHRLFVINSMRGKFDHGKYFALNRFYEWGVLEKDLVDITGLFEYFRTFLMKYSNVDDYNDRATLDLVETMIKDDQLSIPDVFRRIENILVMQTLYYRVMLNTKEQLCVSQQSAQQYLYTLYKDIAFTELKAYIMLQFSWMILKIYEIGTENYTKNANAMRSDFEERAERAQGLMAKIMARADRSIWRCDPDKHVKNVTYDEVTKLMQGYIENEVDMNPDGSSTQECADYTNTKNYGCYKNMFCSKQPRCTGAILNCGYVDSDMWVCPSQFGSTRRYEYIEYENGKILGRKRHCARGTTKVDSWWRWLVFHCSYCFCFCDEKTKSDRYFNLREVVSDSTKNKIVTGLRFRKHKGVFHLQIQEGILGAKGEVNKTTVHWKPIDGYNIHDVGAESYYHTLKWDQRAIDLDDVEAEDPTYVVTGVRFRVVGKHMNIEARMTEFDFESGKLMNSSATSFWKSNDNTDVSGWIRRTEVKLKYPDASSRSRAKSVILSKHNQYIEFTHSDVDADAAQSTVPFIDIQDVSSDPPVPLSGIGIYHKGRDNYGGFIAPKVITYDLTPHLRTSSPL